MNPESVLKQQIYVFQSPLRRKKKVMQAIKSLSLSLSHHTRGDGRGFHTLGPPALHITASLDLWVAGVSAAVCCSLFCGALSDARVSLVSTDVLGICATTNNHTAKINNQKLAQR